MRTITLKENATAEELLKQGAQEEVVVMRAGHPVALLLPFDDDDLEWYIRERDPAFIESIARARKQAAEGHTTSIETLMREADGDSSAP
jgi:PHD/YefM family antitoxin component YafN of YafNO toxin-antitoxin module